MTAVETARAYLRVMHPETGCCPSSNRIIVDMTKCFGPNLLAIHDVAGIIVPGNGSRARNGHRQQAQVDRESEQRGGYHPLGALATETPLHSDAQSWRDEQRRARLDSS